MTEMVKMRQQGLEERTEQVRDWNARVLETPNPQKNDNKNKQELIDKINANKIAFRAEQERLKAEQVLQPKVGLPEMRRQEAFQEEIQANQHQDQVFAAVKAAERFRMGQEQERQNQAQREHAFEMNQKDANNRVLEAGNNPTQRKENDINKDLKRQEEKFKKIMRNPNMPLKAKAIAFKQLAQRLKTKDGSKIKLDQRAMFARQKDLMKKVALRDRKQTKVQTKTANKRNLMTTAAMKRLERCA